MIQVSASLVLLIITLAITGEAFRTRQLLIVRLATIAAAGLSAAILVLFWQESGMNEIDWGSAMSHNRGLFTVPMLMINVVCAIVVAVETVREGNVYQRLFAMFFLSMTVIMLVVFWRENHIGDTIHLPFSS